MTIHNILRICLILVITLSSLVSTMELYNVRFVESTDSRLVATSNYNYALVSPKLLARNWRTVSVNGENIMIVTTTGEKQQLSKAEMSEADRSFIETLRDEIASSNNLAGLTGGSTSSFTSSSGQFSTSSSSTSSSSSSGSSFQSMTSEGGGMSVNMKDDNNFSVSKSDLPYNWSRVFYNGDMVTFIYKTGEVKMKPMNSLEPSQLEAVNKLRTEVNELQKSQTRQITNTMQQSVDMVSNVFDSIMGRFPRPPSYESAVGDMFGSNFPFGPNNSPFSSSSGWPFGSGGGSFAFASGR